MRSTFKRTLPVVGAAPAPAGPAAVPASAGVAAGRHPPWLKVRMPAGDGYFDLRARVGGLGLHTVCQSASCPNIGECWNRRALTIMILGNVCTRSCRFCDVESGRPAPPDPDEPRRVAALLAELDLRHTVITSVDRDDLEDGGAALWAETIREVRARCPRMTLEVLTGDFQGDPARVDQVLAARPHIYSHNLETVPRLSKVVRVQASYPRSLAVLRHAHERGAIVKTGIMLGLGEEMEEVREVVRQLAGAVDVLTFGQYLRPSLRHWPVARYVAPEEFAELKEYGRSLGFRHVEAGPLVRSSYHADEQALLALGLAGQAAASSVSSRT